MPQIFPECSEPYDRKLTGEKATMPAAGKLCHHDVEFEGDADTGVWYVHEELRE